MIRTRFLKIGTIALFAGIPACGSDAAVAPGNNGPSQGTATEIPELGISLDGLGATVASCNNGSGVGSMGNYDTTKTMTLTLGAGSNVISVVGTAITVNGWPCFDSGGVALKTDNVKKLNVNTTVGVASKVVIDMLPGTFGGLFTTTGGVVVDFKGTGDTFALRGDSTVNKFKVGINTGSVYIDATGDAKADIKLKATSAIPTALTFLMGDGADEFDAYDVATVSAAHIDSTVTSLSKLTSTYALTVYGGEGDDKLRGGMGADHLYGNNGNDTFLTDIVPDGADTYAGGAGTDTISYADRTGAVTADISPTGYSFTGAAFPALPLDGATSYTFTVAYDDYHTVNAGAGSDGLIDMNDSTFAFVSATASTLATLVSQFNATPSKPSALTIKMDAKNQLVVQSTVAFQVAAAGDQTALGLGSMAASVLTMVKANDGETISMASEGDDINSDVENLTGGKGADNLTGNDVSNKIIGGDAADRIAGGIAGAACASDVDILDGAAGDDTFLMGAVSDCGDEVIGGAGNDLVDYQYRSAAMNITIDGTANDGLMLELDNVKSEIEELLGGSAVDTITGGTGNEIFHGGAGDDVITGGSGNDTLIGNAGNDTLNGGVGDDLFSASGTDARFTVTGAGGKGDGADIMNGGAGSDKLDYSSRTQSLVLTLCTDTAVLSGASSGMGQCADKDGASMPKITGSISLASAVAFAAMSDALAVTATDNAGMAVTTNAVALANMMTGTQIINALNNATTGLGAGIVASLDASSHLVLTAPEGIATLVIDAMNTVNADTIAIGTATAGTASESDNTVNVEWVVGGSGADTLSGHTASETIEGGAGIDTISGGAGDDYLYGDNGTDTLNGGDGNDTLNGGDGSGSDGADVLNGDNGDADICQALAADTAAATCEQS